MKQFGLASILFILLSILIAMMLMMVPLPHWATWLRPMWVPMVIWYWALAIPDRVSVGAAFFTGIVMDILQGTMLGENAFLLTLLTYFISKQYQRIRLFPLWQQMIIIFSSSLVYLSCQYWLQALIKQPPGSRIFWLPAITTALMWPWVFILLRDYRRRNVHKRALW